MPRHLLLRRRLLLAAFGLAAGPALQAAGPALQGAGATFPAPAYAAWAQAYGAATGVAVAYDAVGSGAGIERIASGRADFGASDVPLSAPERERLGLLQFPVLIGGVVPVVNLSGLSSGALKLDGAVLADIYLGTVRKWNAPVIAALNPGVSLPNANITVVHRSDASGTTFLWSDFLAKTSPDWAGRIGSGSTLPWALGIGGVGNEGVASLVQRTRAAIGYVEYAYAQAHHLPMVAVRNRNGLFVQPGRAAFEAAARAAHWHRPEDLAQLLTWQSGADSWPITGSSFVLLQRDAADASRRRAVVDFFDWAWQHGQDASRTQGYASMPDDAMGLVRQAWPSRDNGG